MAVIVGTNNSEPLVGTEDNDEFFGRGGNDTLSGLGGADIFRWYDGDGRDEIDGGGGSDTGNVNWSAGFPTNVGLFADGGFVSFFAGSGSIGDPQTVILHMDNVENFTLRYTGYTNMTARASVGDLSGTDMTGTVEISGDYHVISFNGDRAVNKLIILGGNGNDGILTGSGDDEIYGYGGNDFMSAGGGSNALIGGPGNDEYYGVTARDTVIEQPGEGIDVVRTPDATYQLRANFEDLYYQGTANFTGIGNEANNWIQGGIGNDYLIGFGGNDILYGAGGFGDALQGGTGDDLYLVESLNSTLTEFAGEGTDRVETTLLTYSLRENLEDLFYSGTGDFHGTGNELANFLRGNAGRDTLLGLDGNDRLHGQGGNDFLDGGNGADELLGGLGGDELRGGGGADRFVYTTRDDGADLVHDFTRADGDKIDISQLLDTLGPIGAADPFVTGVITFQSVSDFGGAGPATNVMFDQDGFAGPAAAIRYITVLGADPIVPGDFIT